MTYVSLGLVKPTQPTSFDINHGRLRKDTPTLPNNINSLQFKMTLSSYISDWITQHTFNATNQGFLNVQY